MGEGLDPVRYAKPAPPQIRYNRQVQGGTSVVIP